MVVEQACHCDNLPAHSHSYRLAVDVDPMYPGGTVMKYVQDEFDVSIWVDWKAVARDYALDERIDRLHGPGAAAAITRAYDAGSIFSDNREA